MKTKEPDYKLARIATAVIEGGKFSYELADWLDDFYHQPRREHLVREPARLAGKVPDGEILDAYLAATASQLCKRWGWKSPAWTWKPGRVAENPWFADPHQFLRATLLLESPSSFRERNLFVSANALSRA